MKCTSPDNFKRKENGRNRLHARICITKEASLTRHEFNWLEQNLSHLSSAIAELNFSLQVREDQIILQATRHEYSVKICFWADDNLTGFPKVTIDIFTDNAFLPLLEDVASQELAYLIHALHSRTPVQKPIPENEASKPWPQSEAIPINGR